MNPINKIKEGIINQNWKLVCEAYEQFTSEKIENPSNITPNNITDKQAIAIVLRKWLSDFDKTEKELDSLIINSESNNSGEDIKNPLVQTTKNDSQKPGHYGNKSILISNEDFNLPVTEDMIKRNEEKAVLARKRKMKRRPNKHEVECSSCGKNFKSDFQSEEIGQQCKNCIKEGIKNKGYDNNEEE